MADRSTYIKLDRNIINWRWFGNSTILSVFIWLLVKANIKEGHFERETVKRGSLVTSNAHIAESCGLTISKVRTALMSLEQTGEIVRNIRNHYQIITIVNYEMYQSDRSKSTYQIASNLDSRSQADRNNQRIKELSEQFIFVTLIYYKLLKLNILYQINIILIINNYYLNII